MKEELRKLLDDIKNRWKDTQSVKTGWLTNTVSRFSVSVPFFIRAVDELMKFMDKFNMPGLSKKAVVMEAITEIYDTVIAPVLPFYLVPFAGTIKELIINVIVSSFIDFLVGRIREVVPKTV